MTYEAKGEPTTGGPVLTVYGATWCGDCQRTKRFLTENQVPYDWVDVEADAEGERFVLETNSGRRRIPTLRFADGTTLTVPSDLELARRLGLRTAASRNDYELIVVGGGPAGLTAATYAAREGIDTLLLERAALGGQAAATPRLDNVPGFPEGITGADLAARLRAQAERFGVEIVQAQETRALDRRQGLHLVRTSEGTEYRSRAVLLATGSRHRRLGVPGEEELLGAGVHYCAICDGPFYRGRPVAVIGGGNSAAEESLLLTRFVDRVTLLVRGDHLKASQVIAEETLTHTRIEARFGVEVERFEGVSSKLRALVTRDRRTGRTAELEIPGAFVFVGLEPNSDYLEGSGVRRDGRGFVLTGGEAGGGKGVFETSVAGVFAAGDLRSSSVRQVATATGEGAAAALAIRSHLEAA